tara:strand:- start:2093 stop:2389 length:297 start_codon:yes stop_codon:yes gene_type:complete
MNPDIISTHHAFLGSTRPEEVYVLRSDKKHDSAGIWHKVFMCYSANTVMMTEFENGIINNTETFNYKEARTKWQNCVDGWWHRDDTCIEGLPLGDVKL